MAEYPEITAGTRLDSALLSSMLPQHVVKTTSQNVTSSTTLVDDDELALPVVSGGTYEGRLVLYYVADTAGDLDYAWEVPSSSAGRRGLLGPDPTAGAAADLAAMQSRVSGLFTTEFTLGGGGAFHRTAVETFILDAGGDGEIRLQWAQGTSNATASTVLQYSHLLMRRLS